MATIISLRIAHYIVVYALNKHMAMENTHGQIIISMKVNILKEKNMEKVHLLGKMVVSMKEIGLKIKGKAKAHILG